MQHSLCFLACKAAYVNFLAWYEAFIKLSRMLNNIHYGCSMQQFINFLAYHAPFIKFLMQNSYWYVTSWLFKQKSNQQRCLAVSFLTTLFLLGLPRVKDIKELVRGYYKSLPLPLSHKMTAQLYKAVHYSRGPVHIRGVGGRTHNSTKRTHKIGGRHQQSFTSN